MFIKQLIFNGPLKLRFQNIGPRYFFSKKNKIIESAEEEPILIEEKDYAELERKRNKSRLTEAHRNILLGKKPYNTPQDWFHETVKYKKRILGRYGMEALGEPAGLAWPTPEEVEDMKEYESLAHPLNIQERLQQIKEKKKMEEEALLAKQAEIEKKMATMKQLIAQVQEKIAQKQKVELEAKERRERKIEEIRRQLIAQGTMSTTKLTEAVTMAEKDEKKLKKELKKAKALEREKKIAERLLRESESNKAEEDEDETDSQQK
ncbi:growth arrest and DNA damage-inducible proteins-interacting protein 1 [Bombus impatiens]|uniref:Large ribosomal subunit protein mL64 n=1 Tax=Bombus impatiens TaxID=132113 RepID=A0A6P3DWI0_BOMIM|nr:growth arrest and DNA damage-inducible proteins-interacting protein 1 [Bombus impatiens]